MTFEDDEERVEFYAALSVTFEGGLTGSIAVSEQIPRFTERIRVWTDSEEIRFEEDEVVVDVDGNGCCPYLDRGDDPNKVEAFVGTIDTDDRPQLPPGRRADCRNVRICADRPASRC